MLRTAFDVKRKAFPVQPRPEFKYWSRVRMDGIQQADSAGPAYHNISSQNIRRNLAISLAALLVFVLASGGTAVASADAMPDQPLYDVKLAVEQVQVVLTPSDTDKAELYATLAEKRADEIAVMASEGKADKVLSTTARMYTQLDLAQKILANLEASGEESTEPAVIAQGPQITLPAPAYSSPATTTPPSTTTPPAPVSLPKPAPSTSASSTANAPAATTTTTTTTTATGNTTATAGPTAIANSSVASSTVTTTTPPAATTISGQGSKSGTTTGTAENQTGSQSNTKKPGRNSAAALRAKATIDASNAKTLSILENALDKAPASVKPSLSAIVEHTRTSNAHFSNQFGGQDASDNDTTDIQLPGLPARPKSFTNPVVIPTDNSSRPHNGYSPTYHHGNGNVSDNSDADQPDDSDNQSKTDSPASTTLPTYSNTNTSTSPGTLNVKTWPTGKGVTATIQRTSADVTEQADAVK